MLTGPFFDALNGIVDLLFGTATSAAPVLAGALNAIGDGARALIDPLNRVVESMKAVFDFGDGPNPFTEILGQAGPMFEDFATGVFEAVRVIAEAINSIGLGNPAGVGVTRRRPNLTLGCNGPGVLQLRGGGRSNPSGLGGIAPILAKIGELVSGCSPLWSVPCRTSWPPSTTPPSKKHSPLCSSSCKRWSDSWVRCLPTPGRFSVRS